MFLVKVKILRRCTRPILGIDILDIFSFVQGPLVRAQSILGKLVYALVGRGTTGFDHVQDTTFIG
jgi:hypothetical protein